MSDLTKTTINDCRSEHVEKLYKSIEENKQRQESSRHPNQGFDSDGSQPQCAQS